MWCWKYLVMFSLLLACISCQETSKRKTSSQKTFPEINLDNQKPKHAQKFSIAKQGEITLLTVLAPWQNREQNFTYALIPKSEKDNISIDTSLFNAVVYTPIEKIVVTSTSHIPFLEKLGVLDCLVGFPNPQYISSPKARNMVDQGIIHNLGLNNQMNIEILLDLQPELVMGFSVDDFNQEYKKIEQLHIPLVYNGDWTEKTPLGRAEWIKFFAPFFHQEHLAEQLFNEIETNYLAAQKIAQNTLEQPTVLSGDLFQNIWYLPGGESFQAQFLKDAHAHYLWAESPGTGSLHLSLESVMDQALDADYWIGPVSHTSYEALKKSSIHYTHFSAYQNQKIYSIANTKGATGGILYYELAPLAPDVVLKDLIKALHPKALPSHEPYFFKPLPLH